MACTSDTVYMLHLDQSLVDSSASAHTTTTGGTVTLVASPGQFSGSAQFDGASGFLTSADSADWDFPADYTVECFARLQAFPGDMAIFSRNTNQHFLAFTTVSGIWGSINNVQSPVFTIALNTGSFFHCVMQRSGTLNTIYFNGTSAGSWVDGSAINEVTSLDIGHRANGSLFLNGYVDEFRIIKGRAVYSGNTITIPPGPFCSNSANLATYNLTLLGAG